MRSFDGWTIGNGLESAKAQMRPHWKELLRYLVKAVAVIAFLTVVGNFATFLPSIAFPLIFLVYAAMATFGAMYNVVAKRLHRQDLYNKDGRLSRFNRKWFGWLTVLFILSLLSAFLFVLEAPSWDFAEWVLIWLAVPFYYVVFCLVRRVGRREYSPKYYKSRAMTWSIFIVSALLCVAYALIVAGFSPGIEGGFKEAVQDRIMPFASSPCALLGEAGKINSYSDYVVRFGLDSVSRSSFIVTFIAKVIFSASVFLGVVGQLGFCLLGRDEIKSEFRLLPAEGEKDESGPILKRYVVVMVVLWLAFSAAFLVMDDLASKTRTTNEYTVVDTFLNDVTDVVDLVDDHDLDEIVDIVSTSDQFQDLNASYHAKVETYVAEHKTALQEHVSAYYNSCVNNVNVYLDWYEGPAGIFARFMRPIGEGMVKDEFRKKVIEPIDRTSVDNEFREYVVGLDAIHHEYLVQAKGLAPNLPIPDDSFVDRESRLNLWPSWESEEGAAALEEMLFVGGDRSAVEAEITSFIEERRTKALSELDAASEWQF